MIELSLLLFLVLGSVCFSQGRGRWVVFFSVIMNVGFFSFLIGALLFIKDISFFNISHITPQKNLICLALSFSGFFLYIINEVFSSKERKSMLYSVSVFLSILLVGANDLIAYFIILDLVIILKTFIIFNLGVSKKNKVATKYFISYFIISLFFILGMMCFFIATNSFSWVEIQIDSNIFLCTSLIFFICTLFFCMGFAPIQSYLLETYSEIKIRGLEVIMLIIDTSLIYSLFSLIHNVLSFISPEYINILLKIIMIFSATNILYGSIKALAISKPKEIILCSLIVYNGYLGLFLSTMFTGVEEIFIFYIFILSLSILAPISMLSNEIKTREINLKEMGLWWFLIFNLIGLPLTLGFYLKYLTIRVFLLQNMWFEIIIFILGSILSIIYYMRILDTKSFNKYETLRIRPNSVLFLFLILIGCAIPLFFYR